MGKEKYIEIKGARANNLKNIDVKIMLDLRQQLIMVEECTKIMKLLSDKRMDPIKFHTHCIFPSAKKTVIIP